MKTHRTPSEIFAAAHEVCRMLREESLAPYSTEEWGMLLGKLSALRWVMGLDWDAI